MVALEASNPFRNLPQIEQNALRQLAIEKNFSAGMLIFKEGDSGDGIYIVKDGLVEISAAVGQNRCIFAKIPAGEMFGDMAVVEFKPRSATATAAKDSTVYFIPRSELFVMLERSPALSLELLRQISQRLRDFNRRYLDETLQAERLAVVGRFARSIIHDLKNPLSIISLMSEMANMDQARPELRRDAQATIRKQVEYINDLVSEILDFTRGSQSNVVFGTIDYATFIQPLLEELRGEVAHKDVTIESEPPPSVRVPLDPKRLRRVFFNLVHNAADAMLNGGKIFLRYRVDGNELITEIEDTGPGVAPEIAGKLFEAFATFGKEHGTGLGLSICKRIVEDHHGRIWVKSQPGCGANFCFALPLSH